MAASLLSETHAVGKWKADFFKNLEFTEDQASVLEEKLLEIAIANDVRRQMQTDYGTKYLIDGNLLPPTGRLVRLRTSGLSSIRIRGQDLLPHIPRKGTMDTPKEHDIVVLRRALDDHGLEEGDVGAVVHVYSGGAALEVEFVTGEGQTITVVTLERDDVRPMGGREILHARNLAA